MLPRGGTKHWRQSPHILQLQIYWLITSTACVERTFENSLFNCFELCLTCFYNTRLEAIEHDSKQIHKRLRYNLSRICFESCSSAWSPEDGGAALLFCCGMIRGKVCSYWVSSSHDTYIYIYDIVDISERERNNQREEISKKYWISSFLCTRCIFPSSKE